MSRIADWPAFGRYVIELRDETDEWDAVELLDELRDIARGVAVGKPLEDAVAIVRRQAAEDRAADEKMTSAIDAAVTAVDGAVTAREALEG